MLFIFILLILIMLAFFQPRWLFKLVEKIAPGVKYFAETEQPIVALTIDDGLHWQTTPKILATLKKYQAHATFFLISERIPSNELIFEQIIQNGHEIGNHMVRDEKSIDLSLNEFEVQLLEADSILSKLVNKHSRTSQGIKFNRIKWFRPGGGWYNQKMIDIAQKYGYQSVLGS
ncbi:MAG TPA: peptidoglycan-N-acetylglucosamine deacetylase, partial [Cyanothece sp. UBA12306]|nr:peptidoglycan-N-acetylglucosamine deacetylase [Cyanothece sp. UBA12306]